MTLLLGLDIGTTSTIGILIDGEGGIRATTSRRSELVSKHANWAEEDPALWWTNVCTLVPELLTAAGVSAADIDGVGVTGMVPTVILLDEEGRPLRYSIQQNDARAVREIEEMRRAIDPDSFFRRTGGSINQQLIAPTLRWLERHEPDVLAKAKTVLGSYDYITGRLCGALSVEQNWALEAGFMDLTSACFDEDLVALGGISLDALPPLRASHELVGEVTTEAASETGLAAGTPVVAGCADHIASAFVAGAAQDGDLVVKFGGAGDIMLSSSKAVTDPRLFIDFHIVPGLYFTNGCMAASGSVLNWIARHLAKAEASEAESEGLTVHALLDRQASEVPPGAGGVVLLPYFLGEKTPLHDPHARGTLVGLGLHHGLPNVWRAALEAVAFGFRHHTEVFAEMGLATRQVLACDGGAASDLWLQITADVLEQPVQRLLNHPGSCLGAAFVAGMGVGSLKDWSAISHYVRPDRVFEPTADGPAIYREAYSLYRGLYDRLRDLYPRFGQLPAC
jgi:xylulokinase